MINRLKTPEPLPERAAEILKDLPRPPARTKEVDARPPRRRKPKSQDKDYIKASLGPYLADELAKLSGTNYDLTIKAAIVEFALAKVAGGKTLAQICVEEGRCFPSKEVLYNWIMRDEGLAQDFKLATEMSVEARVDAASYAVDVDPDMERTKLKVKFTQWYAAKKLPKQYGESKHLVVDQVTKIQTEMITDETSAEEAAKIYAENFFGSDEE